MKKTAIMQPYFMPYLGYWQLISSVDEFVVYDNIEFTKKGWFNRNRILDGEHDRLFTVPIKKDSDYLNVVERRLSDDAEKENARTLRIIQATYKKAPHYADAYLLIERCFMYDDKNLFGYIHHAILEICKYLQIDTKLTISSTIPVDHGLKAAHKVIAICKALDTNMYINSIGGIELYEKDEFRASGLELAFLKPHLDAYPQFDRPFVPGLSIIDIMMFNDKENIRQMLDAHELV
jgi:hypothetical protein